MSGDRDRMERLLFPESEDEWERANAENEAAPREPGRYKVGVAGAPRSTGPTERQCEDCGKVCRSGGGVSFGFHPCDLHGCDFSDCIAVHHHWGEDCPGWRHRWFRLWNRGPVWSVRRRWLSWRWRRTAKRERSDPAMWADYWKDGGA